MASQVHYIFVDFESIQLKGVGQLKEGTFKIKIFLGPNQTKLPASLVKSIQPFGNDAEYITLSTVGKNALDFHIAYYLGVLTTSEPEAKFHIISKDTGFDPLLQHLTEKGIFVERVDNITDITYLQCNK